MADATVIKEFLVNLGYKIDESSQRRFTDSFILVANQAEQLGRAVVGTMREIVGSFEKVAAGMENLYYAGQRARSSVEDIQKITYAVSQMGGTAEGARSSIEGLSAFIRNMPGAQGLVEHLTGKTYTGAAQGLEDIGAALAKKTTAQQHVYAQLLGIDDITLQALIRNSYKGTQEFHDAVQRIHVDLKQASENSVSFMQQLRAVGSVIGLFYEKVVGDLSPKLTAQLEQFRKFMLDHSEQIIKIVERTIRFWLDMGNAAIQLGKRIFEMVSGIIDWWDRLSSSTKHTFELIGLAWVALNSKFLLSPLGIIASLAAAILLLYDDYEVWKEGGKSFIDWSKWEPEIESATAGVKKIWHAIDDFVQKIGGWQTVLEGFLTFMVLKWAIGIVGAISKVGAAFTGFTGIGTLITALRLLGEFLLSPPGVAAMILLYPKSTQTQQQENQGLGRPDNAGPFGGVPGGPAQTPGTFHDEGNIADPAGSGIGGEHLSNQPGGGFLGSSTSWMHRNLPGAFGFKSGIGGELGQKMRNFFQSMGWSVAQATGMVANIWAESHGDPNASNSGHIGIGQWDQARQTNFARLFGHYMGDTSIPYQQRLEEQLRFFDWELKHPNSGSGQEAVTGLQNAQTADQATEAVLHSERPATPGTPQWDQEMQSRTGLAHQLQAAAPITTSSAGGADAGANMAMNQSNSITVNGAADPHATAALIGRELDRHSADLLRAGRGALA